MFQFLLATILFSYFEIL